MSEREKTSGEQGGGGVEATGASSGGVAKPTGGGERGRTLKPIIVKMPSKEEGKKPKLIEVLSKPSNLLFVGALLIAVAYALYPFRASSMLPGILIGGGVAGLIWVAFRVIYR